MKKFKSAKQRRQEASERRYNAKEILLTEPDVEKHILFFKKKATKRMKAFFEESCRMDKKFPEMLAKCQELGITLTQIQTTDVNTEDLMNGRKKTKGLSFNVEAIRQGHQLRGFLTVSPASMRLELNSDTLRGPRTQSGFQLPIFRATYYRTLNIRDNFLSSLVGGGTQGAVELEDGEIPF